MSSPKNKWDRETFRKFIIENRPEIELLTEFTKYRSKVKVRDSDGNIFSIKAGELLIGRGVCGFRTSVDKNKLFINLSNKKHNFKYDYDNCKYTSSKEKVIITCKIHGNFEQSTVSHLQGQGCPKCGKIVKFNTFLEKANLIHKYKYIYIENSYKKVKDDVEIICPDHGFFKQKGSSHLNGNGCLKCAKELNGGYKLKDWIRISENSKNFESYKVYIVELFNDTESFIKIGRTFTTLDNRLGKIPYSYNILEVFSGTVEEMYKLEIKFHKKFKNEYYIPVIKFKGMSECFTKKILKNGML